MGKERKEWWKSKKPVRLGGRRPDEIGYIYFEHETTSWD
jgi:hypothetical protein